ncbi:MULTISPECIES: 3-hydroxybutyrate dehydrogenase [unclassified Mycobacterium]|uniref:3-hydroxybutyrate dehydrogenase n=1 Tax=unclassified Mycobacterium TaxID=2642494 RepID=UPI0007FF1DF2|nr:MULTISPECIES: 3-hydroxybutyrate dehydrogenase [unclassified Mycobacterium]OBH04207.1 3-hydroxybutyrate dehydrogenase [Mycobacterium sp. E2699]OBI51485.1 3-hydroxybutyrate dehydrogenase [Mycobacterium sp. E787]
MIRGKSVLVTGSTSGIGLGIARAFAAEGANVTLNGFGEPEAVEEQRRGIEQDFGVAAAYSGADVTKPDEIAGMIGGAEKTFGAIDVLVNNAGIQFVAEVEDFPVEKWDAVIATNLSAAFHTCRCALPGMKGRGWGRIINIASAHGLVASAGKAAYVAAKHGIIGLTKVVAIETADHGVTCNAISPGWVMTPLVAKQVEARAAATGKPFDEAKQEFVAEKQPMSRYTTPEDIGALAVFLAGDAAATITGASYSIDGGWTAQ